MTQESQHPQVADLVRTDKVHSSVFTDERIFHLELERIFYSTWVYVAHESEVPTPGDYVTKWIGLQPVIVSRDKDGELHVLLNRCRHRANMVCSMPSGNALSFRCAYHGWTYKNDGSLLGVPYPSRYGPGFDKSELGLSRVPRVALRHGFLFASMAETGPSLEEHLGGADEIIKDFADSAPNGQIQLTGGHHAGEYGGNWKFVGMDGYHVNFTHKTLNDLAQRKAPPGTVMGALNSDRSPHVSIDFGNGHCQLAFQAPGEGETDQLTSAYRGSGGETEADAEYRRLLEARYGEVRARRLLLTARDPHLHVWPNLQLIAGQVRVIRPLSASRTEVVSYPALLGGAPEEYNRQRLRATEWFHGPAGLGQPDDYEIFERNTIGLKAELQPWLFIGRGLGLETVNEAGHIIGQVTDEVPQRAHMKAWRARMVDCASDTESTVAPVDADGGRS